MLASVTSRTEGTVRALKVLLPDGRASSAADTSLEHKHTPHLDSHDLSTQPSHVDGSVRPSAHHHKLPCVLVDSHLLAGQMTQAQQRLAADGGTSWARA